MWNALNYYCFLYLHVVVDAKFVPVEGKEVCR